MGKKSLNITLVTITIAVSFLVHSDTDLSVAQNQTQQDNQSAGPLAQFSGRARDVFNGTNQTGGPIAEFGETLQDTFR